VKIVAHVGVIGSGKNYKSEKLIKEQGFAGIDFKDALLDHVSDLVGYDVREDYEYFKDAIAGVRKHGNPYYQTIVVREAAKDLIAACPGVMTGRMLLQRMGTEVMRKRNPQYWIDQFFAKVTALPMTTPGVACSDCRFPNELTALLMVNTHVVFCDYRSARYDAKSPHSSEWMAQAFLKIGLKDGDVIGDDAEREMRRVIRKS